MSGRRPGKGREANLAVAHVYEGPEVLTVLLTAAGSRANAQDATELFRRAQAEGEARSAVIPRLFSEEPRFASPDDARKLYSNLFGLWDGLAADRGAEADARESAVAPHAIATVITSEDPLPPLPERGSELGDVLPADLVETVWRHLDASAPREVQRRRDRFANVQPDLAGWLEAAPLPEEGALAAADLAFEAWAMFDQAFGDRLEAVSFRELRALAEDPPELEAEQPALAAYVAEQLDVLVEEDPAFTAEAREQVERVLAIVAVAMARAVRQPS